MIDLSYSAAKQLEIIGAGIALVEVTRLDSFPLSIPDPIYSPLPILRVGKVDMNKKLQPAC
jgi:rare lipoprotein A (peptidoglycan hydrolase)